MNFLDRKNNFNDPIIITGTTRSGKGLAAPIIASFEGFDKYHMDLLIEQVPFLHHMKLITDDVASYLIKTSYEHLVYNNYIGRNVNFRIEDMSSIWNSRDPREYFYKIGSEEGDNAIDAIKKRNDFFLLNFHNGLMNANLFFKIFPFLKNGSCEKTSGRCDSLMVFKKIWEG